MVAGLFAIRRKPQAISHSPLGRKGVGPFTSSHARRSSANDLHQKDDLLRTGDNPDASDSPDLGKGICLNQIPVPRETYTWHDVVHVLAKITFGPEDNGPVALVPGDHLAALVRFIFQVFSFVSLVFGVTAVFGRFCAEVCS